MTIRELLTEKGLVEGVDYTLSGDELTVLEQIQHIPEVPARTEQREVLDVNGQSFDPAQFEQVEFSPAIPAHDVPFFANIPSIELLYGELVAKEDTGLILGEFLHNKEVDSENDNCNMALFLAGDDSGWRFANIEAPTRKQLYELIPQARQRANQSAINKEAQSFLDATDWMVTRAFERGDELSPEFKAERQAARAAIVR
jgi:hypothetical protein